MLRRPTWIALVAYLVALALIAYRPTPVDRPIDRTLFIPLGLLLDGLLANSVGAGTACS